MGRVSKAERAPVPTVPHFLPNQFWLLDHHQRLFPAPPRQDKDQASTDDWSSGKACWIKAGWVKKGWAGEHRAGEKAVLVMPDLPRPGKGQWVHPHRVADSCATRPSTFQPRDTGASFLLSHPLPWCRRQYTGNFTVLLGADCNWERIPDYGALSLGYSQSHQRNPLSS